ncbi:MAG: 50S ribosomal protein L35 [Candidatus Wolfebacteria bacterium]|nr:50S ribosomal protein L35 [Candidatus Wolfebacteria bacterium]
MVRSSIKTRFRVTRTGKILRRAMAQCHYLSKKKTVQIQRKKHMRGLTDLGKKIVKKYL